MAFFLSMVCLLIVILFDRVEKKDLFISVTPIFALGYPYSIVMILVSLYDMYQPNDYDKMDCVIPLISICFITIFHFIGRMILSKKIKIMRWNRIDFNKRIMRGESYRNKIIKYILVITIFVVVSACYMNFGLAVPDHNVFKIFFSQGIVSHIVNLTTILFLVQFAGNDNTKMDVCMSRLALLWPLFLIVGNAKYSALMYASALLIIKVNTMKTNVSKMKIIVGLTCVSTLFLLTYTLRFLAEGFTMDTIPITFIFNHFFFYLTNGFYTFSKVILEEIPPTQGVGWGVFWAPLLNIFNSLYGIDKVGSMSEFISYFKGKEMFSNTYTLYGSLILETGWVGTFFCIIVLSIFSYTVLRLYLSCTGKYYNSLYAFVCSTLVFSFFNSFYGTVNVWEKIIELFLASFLLKYSFIFKEHNKN